MRILRGHPAAWKAGQRLAVAVGVFDGVHGGHRRVLETLGERAAELGIVPAVLTFDPHPLALVAPHMAPQMLTTIEQRIELFDAAGVELVAVLPFNDSVRAMSARRFVADILVARLEAALVVAGEDFRFGEDRTGDAALLRHLGDEMGFESQVVALVGGNDPTSSTRIRDSIVAGDVAAAARLLGRPFELRGTVVPGEGRGADTGVATANVSVPEPSVIPRHGVYAARAGVAELVPAVVNIGVRPTFGPGAETVEVHLIDRSLDLKGRELRIAFVDRIRDERTFDNVQALAAQIEIDIDTARRMFERTP